MDFQNKVPPSSKNKAFTLVEVMVAMGLMALVFTGVFAVFNQSLRLIEDARDRTRVAQILQSEIESYRKNNWEEIMDFDSWSSFKPQGKFVAAYADRYNLYRYCYNSNPNQREVILVAWWYNSNRNFEWQEYRTIFTRNGLNDYYYRSF